MWRPRALWDWDMLVQRRTFLQMGSASLLAFATNGQMAQAQGLPEVRYIAPAPAPRPDLGFLFLGKATGLFSDLGFNGEFTTVAGTGLALQLLIAGEGQVAFVGMMDLLATKQQNPNLPIRAVYLQDQKSSYEIAVPADGNIKTMADLKGRKIGVLNLGSGSVPFAKAFLAHSGVDPDSVEFLPVGTGAQTLTALARGQVDALSYYRGSVALFETEGMTFRQFAPDLPGAVLVVREDVLAARRADIIAALKGVVLDSVFMQTNPKAAVHAYWKLYGMPKGDVDKALRAGEHLIVRTQDIGKQVGDGGLWGDMNDATWMKLINYMGPRSGLHLSQSALSGIYTSELIAEVNKVDSQIAIKAARNG